MSTNSCVIITICIIIYSALSIILCRLKYFTSMHRYLVLMPAMALLICIFLAVKSDVGVRMSPGYSIRFAPAVSLIL